MKLIDLLRENLPKWPAVDCVAIAQDSRGGVFYWKKTPVFDEFADAWTHLDGVMEGLLDGDDYFLRTEEGDDYPACEDYKTALITREMFEAKMNEPKPIDSVIAARDRIIEIEALQGKLQNEKRDLYQLISAQGFKLDLAAMKK